MNSAYLSAFAALSGSAIGALASFATTWVTQHYQDRMQRLSQESSRREKLYGDFIDQASNLFAHALTHKLEDPTKMVPLFAIQNRMRLFASENTLRFSETAIHRIFDAYYQSNMDFASNNEEGREKFDFLREFVEAGRRDLRAD
jgi:hypothetical protein